MPKTLYLIIINIITRINPTISEKTPASIESFPKSGPTVLSSTILIGAGSAPDLNNKAKSVDSWKEKPPEIVPVPAVIASRICGALIIVLSSTIASLRPILLVVTFPNFCAPNLSKVKSTIGWLDWLSNWGWASTKLSPLITTRLFTVSSSLFSDKMSFSEPKPSSLETSLKVNWAVFPRSSFILSGLSMPGNSTKILLSPLWSIVGSFVPTSSIRLLIISIDCFKAALFMLTRPKFENSIKALFWLNFKSNSNLLYSEIKLLTLLFCCLKKVFLKLFCFSLSIVNKIWSDDMVKSLKFIFFSFNNLLIGITFAWSFWLIKGLVSISNKI